MVPAGKQDNPQQRSFDLSLCGVQVPGMRVDLSRSEVQYLLGLIPTSPAGVSTVAFDCFQTLREALERSQGNAVGVSYTRGPSTAASARCMSLDTFEDMSNIAVFISQRNAIVDGSAREIRRKAGLTLVDVANALGVSATTVGRWESGQRVPRPAPASRYIRLLAELEAQ